MLIIFTSVCKFKKNSIEFTSVEVFRVPMKNLHKKKVKVLYLIYDINLQHIVISESLYQKKKQVWWRRQDKKSVNFRN